MGGLLMMDPLFRWMKKTLPDTIRMTNTRRVSFFIASEFRSNRSGHPLPSIYPSLSSGFLSLSLFLPPSHTPPAINASAFIRTIHFQNSPKSIPIGFDSFIYQINDSMNPLSIPFRNGSVRFRATLSIPVEFQTWRLNWETIERRRQFQIAIEATVNSDQS